MSRTYPLGLRVIDIIYYLVQLHHRNSKRRITHKIVFKTKYRLRSRDNCKYYYLLHIQKLGSSTLALLWTSLYRGFYSILLLCREPSY